MSINLNTNLITSKKIEKLNKKQSVYCLGIKTAFSMLFLIDLYGKQFCPEEWIHFFSVSGAVVPADVLYHYSNSSRAKFPSIRRVDTSSLNSKKSIVGTKENGEGPSNRFI